MITSVKGQRRALQVVGNRSNPCSGETMFPGQPGGLEAADGDGGGRQGGWALKALHPEGFPCQHSRKGKECGCGGCGGQDRGKHGGPPVGGRPGSLRKPCHKEKWGIGGWLVGGGADSGCGI